VFDTVLMRRKVWLAVMLGSTRPDGGFDMLPSEAAARAGRLLGVPADLILLSFLPDEGHCECCGDPLVRSICVRCDGGRTQGQRFWDEHQRKGFAR
jgi:hypothetical protein